MAFFPIPKSFILKNKKSNGRNTDGRITVFHRGGGNRKRLRLISFFSFKKKYFPFFFFLQLMDDLENLALIFLKKVKDSSRQASLGLVQENQWGSLSLRTLSEHVDFGHKFFETFSPLSINRTPAKIMSVKYLRDIPLGVKIFNVELRPFSIAKIGRSAGVSCILRRRVFDLAIIECPSGKLLVISSFCRAVLGTVSFFKKKKLLLLKKAGANRWQGNRPVVKGRAMNPIDHPHGGRTSIGKLSVTPWGKLTKGFKTIPIGKRRLRIRTFNKKVFSQRNRNTFAIKI